MGGGTLAGNVVVVELMRCRGLIKLLRYVDEASAATEAETKAEIDMTKVYLSYTYPS
jgi:hypothetical protein